MKTPLTWLFIFGMLACLHAQSSEEEAPANTANIQAILEKEQTRTLADLLVMSPEELAKIDIAEMQFLSLQDPTPAAKDLTTLFQMVDLITTAAKKHVEGKSGSPGQQVIDLIDALKGANVPGMPYPILYLSVGRRLGYPLKLAIAQEGTLSIRSVTDTASYHVDLSTRDIERVPKVPDPVPVEAQVFYFLTPANEFSYFLAQRGAMLEQQGQNAEALIAYTHALLLSPGCRNYVMSVRGVAPKLTRFFGRTGPRFAPDYSQRPDEIAEMDKAFKQMSDLASAEALEMDAAFRQHLNDPAAREKSMNAIKIKYDQEREQRIAEQSDRLLEEELQRMVEKARQGY